MSEFPEDIKGQIDTSKQQKVEDVKIWELSLKFLEGKQWLNYDRNLATFINSPLSSRAGGIRATVNLLLNVYRNLLAKLRLAYPGIVVLPASPSTEDITKAKSSEVALRYYWVQGQIKDVLGKALEWLITCGTAALHTYYDPAAQQVVTKAVSPYDLFFEPDVVSVDDSQWVAIRTYESKESLKKAYSDFEEEIEAFGKVNADEHTAQSVPDDRVELFEIYWRDGKHAIVLGDIYLYQDPEYPVPTFPIQVFKYTHVPRKLWGMSLLAPLVDLQWLYNKSRSQLLNNIDLMANPKWLIPKTAGVSKNAITSRPGEKIYYNAAGGAPKAVQGVPMPNYVMDNVNRLQAELLDVSGVHNISLGKREIGVTSGKAIAALAQQDSSQLHVTQMHVETAVQSMAKVALMLMKTFYKEAKLVRMLDSTGNVIFKQLQATDIVDDPEIFIETGSLFRDEAQDRDAKILEMAQLGLIEKEVAIQELSFRTGNSFITEKIAGIAHAQEILDACTRGFEVEIFRTDDLAGFKKVFGEFMRTPKYYALSEQRQEYIRDVFIAVATADAPPEQYAAAAREEKVFPRAPDINADPAAKAAMALAPDSPEASQQNAAAVAEQALDVATLGAAQQNASAIGPSLTDILGG